MNINDFQLQEMRMEDLRTVLDWRNSKRIKSWMYTNHDITWEEHLEWFQRMRNTKTSDVLLLHYQYNPIGLVQFVNIDEQNGTCFWGFYIGEQDAPKGAGTVMGLLALNRIFTHSGINKVCGEAINQNIASIRFHKKLGFVTEGVFVNHIYRGNDYIDVIRMALFKEKWLKSKERILVDLSEG